MLTTFVTFVNEQKAVIQNSEMKIRVTLTGVCLNCNAKYHLSR